METLLYAAIAVTGGFLVGRLMMGFVDFVVEFLKKDNNDR
jgi:hypothetical protein|tara:strand:- start:2298 stop:2417 length:120 start_codon:yes stop_codon:yes gene_type:complete